MLKLKRKTKKSEKGMAFVEAIPVLFMVVILFNFSLGFFGALHSGILNSIASYNYTMETFRFRSNLMYFRPGGNLSHYKTSMNRVHGVTADGVKNDDNNKRIWPATVRAIAFVNTGDTQKLDLKTQEDNLTINPKKNFSGRINEDNIWHVKSDYVPTQDQSAETAEIWIKTVYGICLNAECKPAN